MTDIDSSSLIVIISIGAGVIGLLIRYCFKSKCDRVEICNGYCLRIHREVNNEDNNISEEDSQKNKSSII